MTRAGPRETWKETLAYHAYRLVAWLGATLPESTGRRLFGGLGKVAYRLTPAVRATVGDNQSRVLGRPPDDPLVRASTLDAFERYGRFWFDAFHARRWSDEEVLRRFRAEGGEHIDRALAAGTGVIIALPHMGNWDVAGRWLGARGQGAVCVAERLRPERLYRLFVEHREQLGMEIVGLDDGGVGRQLSGALKRNRVVCLVADRELTGRGVQVEMFGRSRGVPVGPALLSLTTGAPLLTAAIYEESGDFRCVILAPIEIALSGDRRRDVEDMTRAMAAAFERAIAGSPPDWHMFQPGWDP